MKPVKVLGAVWKEFYNAPWGEDAYHDDSHIQINGQDINDADLDLGKDVKDTDEVTVHYGALFGVPGHDDLAEFLAAWLKKRTTATLVVEVPLDGREALVAAIRAAGGRVL